MDNIRTFHQPGISLLILLRSLAVLLFLAALFTPSLVACGGNGGSAEQPSKEEATAGAPESTRGVQLQRGAELTTEE